MAKVIFKATTSGKSSRREGEIKAVPISFLAEYANGVRSAKSVLATFYGSTDIDFYAQNAWIAIEKSLEIFAEADDEDWGRIQWGDHPWQCVNVKDRWEFLDRYIRPIIEHGKRVSGRFDKIDQEAHARCEQKLKDISAANPHGGRKKRSVPEHSQKTQDDAKEVAKKTAEGKIQEHIADDLHITQQRVSQLLKINKNTSFQQDNILSKTSKTTPKPTSNYGTSKAHAIARLKRDGYANLAQQVESGQMTAAAARREAGYVIRERSSFSVSDGTKAESLAKTMAEKLSPEFINDLYSELGKLIQEQHNEHNWIP